MEGKQVTKWTTLSVSTDLRPLLDIVMLEMAKKMSYNQIIEQLCIEYLKNKDRHED